MDLRVSPIFGNAKIEGSEWVVDRGEVSLCASFAPPLSFDFPIIC